MIQGFLPLAECIDVTQLPSISVADHQALPCEGGLYFVVNAEDVVCYIGRTQNLSVRWRAHHRLKQYTKEPGYRIAWLTVSNTTLLPAIEKACIAYFAPADNGEDIPLEDRSTTGRMETKHQTSIRLSPEVARLLAGIAKQLNLSKSTVFELAIREYAARHDVR